MNHQKGATLVMVLVILVLITFLGTIAIRSSLVGLKISTNSQVRSLLLENSNSALFNIEDPKQIARQLARDGMFSYFSAADNSDDELIFCYKAKESKFFKEFTIPRLGFISTTSEARLLWQPDKQ